MQKAGSIVTLKTKLNLPVCTLGSRRVWKREYNSKAYSYHEIVSSTISLKFYKSIWRGLFFRAYNKATPNKMFTLEDSNNVMTSSRNSSIDSAVWNNASISIQVPSHYRPTSNDTSLSDFSSPGLFPLLIGVGSPNLPSSEASILGRCRVQVTFC